MTASRAELLESIRPGMKLDKNFFLRIYGYSITTPEFAASALDKLEGLYILYAQPGEKHPSELYKAVANEYEALDRQHMKEAGEWYAKELENRQERQVNRAIAGNRKSRYQFAGFPENW